MMTFPLSSEAAVFHAPGEPLRLERYAIDAPWEGEALVRIVCATICGSDLHTYYGRRPAPAPSVLGHEMVGEVVALGPGGMRSWEGDALQVGDRVTWSMVWSCGTCLYCGAGLPAKCERLMKFGHERIGGGRDLLGGFATHCRLPAGTAVFRVPGGLPDEVASPANCATATVAAVVREAGAIGGETVVVLGAGMLGLTACTMARENGARQVIAVEPDPARRALALRFGADTAMAVGASEPVRALTGGRGAEVVLDFCGRPEAIESAWPMLRFGGRLVLAGTVFPARDLALPAEQIVRRMLRISGVYNYAPQDLAAALAFLDGAHRRYPFAELAGGVFSLSEIEQAFDYAEHERPPRVVVRPGAI